VPAFGKFKLGPSLLAAKRRDRRLFLASQQPIVSGGESQTTIGVVRVTLTHWKIELRSFRPREIEQRR